MTISKLATETWRLAKTRTGANRYYKRIGNPKGVILHHAATTKDSALAAAFVSPTRELSANYAMRQNGTLVAVLHEEYRAFTSASPKADNWGITIEVVNSSLGPNWEISDAAFDKLARWLADMSIRWNWGPLSRKNVIGHREVRGIFGQGYATACPGGIWPRMDALIARANEYRAAPAKPAPAKPSAPAPAPVVTGSALLKGAALNDTLVLDGWYVYDDAALTKNKRAVDGHYKIIGITYKARRGGEPSIRVQDGRGAKAWLHYSAVNDGLVKAGATPPPAPAPAPTAPAQKQARINGHVRLEKSWYAFNYGGPLRNKRPFMMTPGTYQIKGIDGGDLLLEGNGRRAWVDKSAQKFLV